MFWITQTAKHFETRGYEIIREYQIKGRGAVDILASRPGERVAVEVETGKSDIKQNLEKVSNSGFDRVVFVATSPMALGACQKAISAHTVNPVPAVELLSWLDIS